MDLAKHPSFSGAAPPSWGWPNGQQLPTLSRYQHVAHAFKAGPHRPGSVPPGLWNGLARLGTPTTPHPLSGVVSSFRPRTSSASLREPERWAGQPGLNLALPLTRRKAHRPPYTAFCKTDQYPPYRVAGGTRVLLDVPKKRVTEAPPTSRRSRIYTESLD